jgi:hypothetical protein
VRGPLRFLVAAILLALAGVVVAPAAWLDRPLASRTEGRARLVDAEGLWWRGRGALASADGAARLPIAWRVALAPLVTGTLRVDFVADGDAAMPSGAITVRREALEIRDVRLRAAGALLGALVPALKPFALGGDVVLSVPVLDWRGRGGSGTVDASWERARIITGTLALDLGAVTLSVAPQGDALAGTVRNRGGDVAIDGAVRELGGIVDASLLLTPAGDAPELVRQVLPLLGAADPAGGVRVRWRSGR